MTTITSANTSIKQVPAIYKNKHVQRLIQDTTVLDYGAGKYDDAKHWAKSCLNADVYCYDPYNRSKEENDEALNNLYRVCICSNVLNVIKDRPDRWAALEQMLSRSDVVCITVYEGDGYGEGRVTKEDCWQNNQPTAYYEWEINQFIRTNSVGSYWKVFRFGKLIMIVDKQMVFNFPERFPVAITKYIEKRI